MNKVMLLIIELHISDYETIGTEIERIDIIDKHMNGKRKQINTITKHDK